MSESYFQMKDLSVGYHGNVLIHDICTEIKKGEILTLIGPNGSGKSTILKSITKQLTLIGGKVTIGEKNLKDLSYKELATKMAVVLTQRAKPELMTCYEVVAAGRYPYTGRLGILTREDEKKTQEALELSMQQNTQKKVLRRSVTGRDSGSFWQERSVRNRRS